MRPLLLLGRLGLAPPGWGRALSLIALAQLAAVAIPYLLKLLVDGLAAGTLGSLWVIGALWSALQLVHGTAQYFGQIQLARLGQRAQLRVRERLYHHLLRQPLTVILQTHGGEQISVLEQDSRYVAQLFSSVASGAIRLLIGVGGAAVVLLVLEPRVLLLAFIPLPLLLLLGRLLRRRFESVSEQLRRTHGELFSAEHEALSAIEQVICYGLERRSEQRVVALAKRLSDLTVKRERQRALLALLLTSAATSVLIAVAVGARFVQAGQVSIGELVAAYAYLMLIISPLRTVPALVADWSGAAVALRRIDEAFQRPEAPERTEQGEGGLSTRPPRVELHEIAFFYEDGDGGETTVLGGLSLTIEPGGCAAILGPSGGGKTTIGRLLPRLLVPVRGQLLLDGRPAQKLSLADLRSAIGYVDQRGSLFSTTIYDNIACGLPDNVDEAERERAVQRAVRVAKVDEILERRGVTLQAEIGPQGVQLSGGQRKRIALARALVRQPRLLIIDQMASDLEDQQNQEIFTALRRDYPSTLLYLGHRIPAGLEPDQIVWLEGGKIASR